MEHHVYWWLSFVCCLFTSTKGCMTMQNLPINEVVFHGMHENETVCISIDDLKTIMQGDEYAIKN